MSDTLSQATEGLTLSADNVADFSQQHPLNSRWTLWYTKPKTSNSETWADLLKPVISFSTIEEFWGIFHAIPTVSELPLKADYHLFREDIRPEWEDEHNAQGGKFSYSYSNKRAQDINDAWLAICLALIGEVLQDDENEVNGIVFSNRRNMYKVALWTKSSDKKNLLSVGEKFKLAIGTDDLIEFFLHKDADVKTPKPLMMI